MPTSTAEDIVAYIADRVRTRVKFPSNITQVELGVDEGYGQGAWTSFNPGRKTVKA